MNAFQQAHRGFLSPCYLLFFQSGSKNVNKRGYLGIVHFTSNSEFKMNVLK